MITLNLIKTSHPDYEGVEKLLLAAFPEAERRDTGLQRKFTDENEKFQCYAIRNEEMCIGVITVWSLNGFHYIEHFATVPEVRNKGYGKEIMGTLTGQLKGTVILEVERPEDEMSRRRIGFYERCGFTLCKQDYLQPPSRKGGEAVPLYLMFIHTESIDGQYTQIRDEIYGEVYQTTPEAILGK